MPIILIDPRDEAPRRRLAPAPRLETLDERPVALLDISKPGGSFFLDRLEELLRARFRSIRIVRETKPTFARPAAESLLQTIVRSGAAALVAGLAD